MEGIEVPIDKLKWQKDNLVCHLVLVFQRCWVALAEEEANTRRQTEFRDLTRSSYWYNLRSKNLARISKLTKYGSDQVTVSVRLRLYF